MQTLSSLFIAPTNVGRKKEGNKENNSEPSRNRRSKEGILLLTILLVIVSFRSSASADFFSPAPPSSNVVNQTSLSVSLTSPATTVYINVTKYDPQQMVKNITLWFNEPITYVSLVIDMLKEKPLIVGEPSTIPVIRYYDIRFLTDLTDKITNITIDFSVERNVLENMSLAGRDILHYQYDGSRFERCQLFEVGEDKTSLFFETETNVSLCFAIAGSKVPVPMWVFILSIIVIAFTALSGMLVYKKRRSKHLQNSV